MSERGEENDPPFLQTVTDQVLIENEVLEDAVESLEAWLVDSADAGVPELVLVGVLRAYAAEVEACGFVPRAWGANGESE